MRGLLGPVLVAVGCFGCGFPEHTFIPDEQFDNPDAGLGGAGGSSGASTGGSGGAGTGGTSGAGGVGGSGGAGGTGGPDAGSGGMAAASGQAGQGGDAGGTTGGENCRNGVDDDGDNDIDCQDSECQANYTCAPALPGGGWEGPVALWSGGGTPPDCLSSGGYSTVRESGNTDLSSLPASCKTCGCTTPSGGTCETTASITYYTNTNCTGGRWEFVDTLTSGAACASYGMLHGQAGEFPQSARFVADVLTIGACSVQESGAQTLPAVQWSTLARACGDATAGAGCGTGMCLPIPRPPFQSDLCVFQAGDVACPAGPYSTKRLFYKSVNDTRGCTACSCGTANGQACGGLRAYTDSCASDEVSLVSGTCSTVPVDPTLGSQGGRPIDTRGHLYVAGAPSGGSCPASGGQPTGSVTPANPLTFCCM